MYIVQYNIKMYFRQISAKRNFVSIQTICGEMQADTHTRTYIHVCLHGWYAYSSYVNTQGLSILIYQNRKRCELLFLHIIYTDT